MFNRFRTLSIMISGIALIILTGCGSSPTDHGAAPPSGPQVLAVKIDNVAEGRPPVGLGAADMVYVEPVEGGFSRMLAIFGSQKPPLVGPVRSARETDADILPQFGHPTLAFSGAAPELLPTIDSAPLTNASDAHHPDAYRRDAARPTPHNLFVDPAKLPAGAVWPEQNRPVAGPAPDGGTPTERYDVRYPSATVGFTWDQETARWNVAMDNAPFAAADSGQLGASTVVIQHVNVRESAIRDTAGNPSPIAQTIGNGKAQILRDGKTFDVTWERPSANAPTTYRTASGTVMPTAPGQTWVVLTP